MAYKYFTQLFTGGLNKDVDPAMIDMTAQQGVVQVVSDAQNMLFERGLAITRPGLAAIPGPPGNLPSTANLRALKALPISPRSRVGTRTYETAALAATDAQKLYVLNGWTQGGAPALDPTVLTGPAFFDESMYYRSISVVNGVVMVAGQAGGLLRWDANAGLAYTQIANSGYKYVIGHLARGVAAYDMNYLTPGYGATIAWSVPGDETLWGPPNYLAGAGISILGDCDDSITGLDVAKGFVVVARTYGFHIGVPTGSTPPYDWKKMSGKGIGVMHPATFLSYKDTLFFMSQHGIHQYDLVDITDIGEGIYKEINSLIQTYNLIPRAFISNGYSPDEQPSYNIILDSAGSLDTLVCNTFPHYMYNLREKKWSRHLYTQDAVAHPNSWSPQALGFDQLPHYTSGATDPAPVSNIAVYTRVPALAPGLTQWTAGANLDAIPSITTGLLTVDDPTADVQLSRMLFIYKAAPSSSGYLLFFHINFLLDGQPMSTTVDFLTYPAGGWDRRWVDVRLTGNMIQVSVSVLLGSPTPTEYKALILEYSIVGKGRV